ncbi:SUF system Fe-S cluster assembly regulator [Caballeronia sp. S22]|uniref:SUF system Fe-S cluster assembly regulator n=1 Tax=Caballeronia sp. S22 TaxID=3137182 RepID=UPI003530F511
MLRMSKLADYGTVIMTAMARDPDSVQSASSIAAATGVAMPTVSKVLKTLSRDGLVVSLRGINGGYLLPRPPERITLADVIAAVDGPFGMTECSAARGLCMQEAACSIRANWQKISAVVYETLRQVTLADMARPTLRTVDISVIRSGSLAGRPPNAGAPVSGRALDGDQI